MSGLSHLPLPLESFPVPAHPGTLAAILTACSLAFLVPAALITAWPLMTLVAEAAGRSYARTSLRRLAEWMARRTPGVAVLAIALGLPVLFISLVLYGNAMFPAALQAGVWWLSVIPLLFFGVGASFWTALRRRGTEPSTLRPFLPDIVESYILAFRRRGLERPGLLLTSLAAVSFLFIGFVMVAHGVIAERPALWGPGSPPPSGTFLPWSDPLLLRRLVHFLLGALSLGGLAVAWHGADRIADGETAYGRTALRFGALVFAVPVALQAAAGPLLATALPPETFRRLGGGTPGGGWLLWGAASAGFLAAVLAALATALRDPRGLVRTSAGLFVIALAGMVAARQQVRSIRLASFTGPAEAASAHSIAIAIFVVVTLAGVAALGWMLLVSRREAGPGDES